MRPELVEKAAQTVPELPLLINMVSTRVAQLSRGRNPLVLLPPSYGAADIALTEIIEGKIVLNPDGGVSEVESDFMASLGA